MEEIIIPVSIIAAIIIFSPAILIILIARNNAQQRKRYSIRLLMEYEDELKERTWFPVRFASKTRFYKIWKVFPWEDYGIILIEEKTITLYAKKKNIIHFPVPGISLMWLGTKMWPNGIIAWFLIRYENRELYVTSDTGIWATKSSSTTKDIYEKIKMIRAAPSSEASSKPSSDNS